MYNTISQIHFLFLGIFSMTTIPLCCTGLWRQLLGGSTVVQLEPYQIARTLRQHTHLLPPSEIYHLVSLLDAFTFIYIRTEWELSSQAGSQPVHEHHHFISTQLPDLLSTLPYSGRCDLRWHWNLACGNMATKIVRDKTPNTVCCEEKWMRRGDKCGIRKRTFAINIFRLLKFAN